MCLAPETDTVIQSTDQEIFTIKVAKDPNTGFAFGLFKSGKLLGCFSDEWVADTTCGFLNFFGLLRDETNGSASVDTLSELFDFLKCQKGIAARTEVATKGLKSVY